MSSNIDKFWWYYKDCENDIMHISDEPIEELKPLEVERMSWSITTLSKFYKGGQHIYTRTSGENHAYIVVINNEFFKIKEFGSFYEAKETYKYTYIPNDIYRELRIKETFYYEIYY